MSDQIPQRPSSFGILDGSNFSFPQGVAAFNAHAPGTGVLYNGVNDDGPGLQATYNLVPIGHTFYIPAGAHRIATPVRFNRAVNIKTDGTRTAFIPDCGAGQDAITFGTSGGAFISNITVEAFAILSPAANCCRNGLVINRLTSSRFLDCHVQCAAANAGTVLNGLLICRARVVTSVNTIYAFPGGLPVVHGIYVSADTGAIGCNANEFDLVVEGGTCNGVYVDDQQGQGNSRYIGCVEGNTGTYPFYAKSAHDLSIAGFHHEANGGVFTLDHCTVFTIGPSVLVTGANNAGKLALVACRNGVLDGVRLDSLVLDTACDRVEVGVLDYNVGGTGSIIDPAKAIISRGLIGNISAVAAVSNGEQGAVDAVNLFQNGTLERWDAGDNAIPFGFTFVGASPAFQKCGDALADTRRNFSRYCARVTTVNATHAPGVLVDFPAVANGWMTVNVWVYSAEPRTLTLSLWLFAGGAVVTGDAYNNVVTAGAFVVGKSYTIVTVGTTNFIAIGAASNTIGVTFTATGVGAGTGTASLNEWAKLSASFWVDGVTYTQAEIVVSGSTLGTWYLAEVTYGSGLVSARRVLPPANVAQAYRQLDSMIETAAAAMPVAGAYRKNWVVWNTALVIGGGAGTQYFIHGWRRLTDGSAHLLNTDWAEMRCLTGT